MAFLTQPLFKLFGFAVSPLVLLVAVFVFVMVKKK